MQPSAGSARGQPRAEIRPLAELEDLGPRVEQRHRLEGQARALGDAAHLLDVGGIEALHLGHELVDQGADGRGVERQTGQLPGVVLDAEMDAGGGLVPVLAPPLARGPRHLDERERLGHPIGRADSAQRPNANFWNAWVPSGTWPRLAAKVQVTSLT